MHTPIHAPTFGTDSDREISLPPEASALGPGLMTLARAFLSARRRHGLALLHAARALQAARAEADEGNWYLFLRVTQTSHDVAERLLNIALMAERDSAFADAVIHGRLNQTVAGLLARSSTPPEVRDRVLALSLAPRVRDVYQALRAVQGDNAPADAPATIVESPHYAGHGHQQPYGPPLPLWLSPLCEQLARARTVLLSAHGDVRGLDDRAAAMLVRELGAVEVAIDRIRSTLRQRRVRGR